MADAMRSAASAHGRVLFCFGAIMTLGAVRTDSTVDNAELPPLAELPAERWNLAEPAAAAIEWVESAVEGYIGTATEGANCSKDDAQIIWDNLKLGAGPSTDKLAVKAAFERNYQCMGVKCSDVGALTEAASGDAFGKACVDPDPEALRTVEVLDTGATIGIVVACCVAVAAVLCIFVMICKEKKGAPIFTH